MKMNMKTTILTIVALLIVMALLAAGSLAWFYAGDNVEMRPAGETQGQGSIQNAGAAYFNGGDGTKGAPYQIYTKEQMYNFAWLQYLGSFNQVDDEGNIVQIYFKLTNNIDMKGDTLPPIGTATNPFLGNFDGGNYTISNLKVDNRIVEKTEDDTTEVGITDVPDVPDTTINNAAFKNQGVEIVGLFGVVGSIGETDYTYDSTANVIKNFYIENITVRTQTENSLIGIVAGYVNGTVQNVGVIGKTTISIAATNPLSYTSNMSDFSLVGYCTQAYKSQSNTVTLDGSLDGSGSGGSGSGGSSGGSGIGWGGSIGINALHSRLAKVYGETSSKTAAIDTYVSTESRTYNMFKNTVEVSFTISKGSSGQMIRYQDYGVNGAYAIHNTSYNYYNVYGHSATSGGTNTVTLNAAENAYWIFMAESGPYLNRNGFEVTAASVPTTMWALDTDGHLYTVEPGTDTKYYLSVDTNGSSLVTTPSGANQWTLNGGTLKVNGAAQYLSHDGTKWCLQASGSFAQANSQVTYTKTVTQGRNSYFPINVKEDDNFSISDNNTGYFVGGSYGATVGDFRTTSYRLSEIWKAFGKDNSSGTIDLENDKLQVYTRTATSGDKFCLIKDDYNKDAQLSDKLTANGEVQYSYSDLGLEKYSNARAQLKTILDNCDLVYGEKYSYGLRFMQTEISKDHLITAPVVNINGKTMYNYEMPESCIDFQLAEKGQISFFAATVSGSPNYFLSLHEIIRNPDNTIQEIKKIQKIYQDGNSYIYEYSDGTFSGTKTDQAKLAFDLDWIMNPMHTGDTSRPLVLNSVYYFEIPVNAGEYALGSHTRTDVRSSLGSYLLYLDIGANGNEGGDEGGGGSGGESGTTETIMSATANQYIYPNGVDFLEARPEENEENSEEISNSAAIILPSGTTGETSFSRAGDIITVKPGTGLQASYIKDGIDVKDENDSEISSKPINTKTVYLKKVAQTTGGKTTVSIYTGPDEDNVNILILTYSYTAGDVDDPVTTGVDMDETSTWTLTLEAKIDVSVDAWGDSGFAITINGKPITTAPTTITVPSS